MVFRSLILGLAACCLIFFGSKATLNYAAVCTDGLAFWEWRHIPEEELISVLQRRGSSFLEGKTKYFVAFEEGVPGDHYDPATFLQRIRGRAAVLIHYRYPWRADTTYTIKGGYFYAPNCLTGWKPPF